jgi:hypothetical protein
LVPYIIIEILIPVWFCVIFSKKAKNPSSSSKPGFKNQTWFLFSYYEPELKLMVLSSNPLKLSTCPTPKITTTLKKVLFGAAGSPPKKLKKKQKEKDSGQWKTLEIHHGKVQKCKLLC